MTFQEIDGGLTISVDKEIYNIDVLHKCFYWYMADFTIDISNQSADMFSITIKSKKANESSEIVLLIEKIRTDLMDFKVRDIVTKETANVRDLLIAKAFSNYEPVDDPAGKISDAVGYNPNV